MSRYRPTFILVFVLLAAVGVLVGGVLMARRTEVLREERDRDPLKALASSFQAEVSRLEELYNTHLRALAVQAGLGDSFELKSEAERVIGVRQVSMLPLGGGNEVHTRIGVQSTRVPVPVLVSGRTPNFGVPEVMPLEMTAASPGATGWYSPAGEWRYFWFRRDGTSVVVIAVEAAAVQAAMRGVLKTWGDDEVRPVRAVGGPDALMEVGGEPLVTVGSLPGSFPDWILPVRSGFGEWEAVSWYRERPVVRWRWPVLAGASAFSAALGWLAIAGFVWQKRLERLATQRVSFVNRVSHELRTPLTNIVLNAELASDALELQPMQAGGRLELIREEAGRLTRLIDNVLAFSNRDSSRPARPADRLNPGDLIASAARTFEPAFGRRRMELRVTGDAPACQLEPDGFIQILANLLSNAEKYAAGGDVDILFCRVGAELVVQVKDHGPGVAEAEAQRIFEPFVRLSDRLTEGVAGAGLGLGIARDAAQKLGGTLKLVPASVMDGANNGAVFELRLPVYADERVGQADPVLQSGSRATAPALHISTT
jgi:signal transduction histidine kinase